MELSDQELQTIGQELDHAMSYGQDAGIKWLRAAFVSHRSQITRILKDFQELKTLFLRTKQGTLSVREAQLCAVCRLCRQPYTSGGTFLFNYGEEFAHEKCLKEEQSNQGAGI